MDYYRVEEKICRMKIPDFLKDYVDVPKFLALCKECPNYEILWSCPSYDFNPIDYWKQYDYLEIKMRKIIFDVQAITSKNTYRGQEEIMNTSRSIERSKMDEALLKRESLFPAGRSLSPGSCISCGENDCTRKNGQECLHPDLMRYSIESLGGNVGKIAKDIFDTSLEWLSKDHFPSHLLLIGGILYKEEK